MEKKTNGELYLIPNRISDSIISSVFPSENIEVLKRLDYYICEHAKELRVLFKSVGMSSPYDQHLVELNKRTNISDYKSFLNPLLEGHDMGLVSDSGCPGIADPGEQIVREAHKMGVKVRPLVGPSSILMALMSSGMSGQKFAFNGYLSSKETLLTKELAVFERKIHTEKQTQIFIETPYRNQKLLNSIIKNCSKQVRLGIAYDITGAEERIEVKTVGEWKLNVPLLNKMPCVFILGGDGDYWGS